MVRARATTTTTRGNDERSQQQRDTIMSDDNDERDRETTRLATRNHCKSTHCLTDLVCVLGTTRIGNTSIRLYKELSLGGLRDDAKVAQPKGEPPSTMEGKTKGPKQLASQNSD